MSLVLDVAANATVFQKSTSKAKSLTMKGRSFARKRDLLLGSSALRCDSYGRSLIACEYDDETV